MSHHNPSGPRPSIWAVAALFGSSAFLLGSLMLVIGNVSPF
jgi:hypothetical protein